MFGGDETKVAPFFDANASVVQHALGLRELFITAALLDPGGTMR